MTGFCVPCGADVVSATTRSPTCPQCGSPLIAPSFGDRWQRWTPEGWVPPIDQPAATPPRARPAPPPPPHTGYSPVQTMTCTWCNATFTTIRRGGSPQRFCGEVCKSKYWIDRRSARRRRAIMPTNALLRSTSA